MDENMNPVKAATTPEKEGKNVFQFRKLYASEIDCRISTINQKGATLLLYKNARVDQTLLDETFGIFGWQRSHQLIGDRLYCTVSIKDPDTGEWISKQDVGTESYTEKEKGQASDSFKRACFNIGIGRELYTAPFIWIPSSAYKSAERNGKLVTYDRFKVTKIEYDSNSISALTIVNEDTGKEVFAWPVKGTPRTKTVTKDAAKANHNNDPLTDKQLSNLQIFIKNHGCTEEQLSLYVNKKKFSEWTIEDFGKLCKPGALETIAEQLEQVNNNAS